MSKITLTFGNKTASGIPINMGSVIVVFNNSSGNITLKLDAKSNNATGRFHWRGVPDNGIGQSTNNYALAFNRDFKNIGGNNNLIISVIENNVVEINASNGTFVSASFVSDIATFGSLIENTPATPELLFSITKTTVGNCFGVQIEALASGGVSPYVLKNGNITIDSSWDGLSKLITIDRNILLHDFNVSDSELKEKRLDIIAPKKLSIGGFSESISQYNLSSDLIIVQNEFVAGTTPLQFSLDNIEQTTGTNYVSSNSFSGLLEGLYKVFIKDVFGCEISKIIQISGFQDANVTDKIRYFDIPEGQSIIVSEYPEFNNDIKKNYFNTGSYNQQDYVLYPTTQIVNFEDKMKAIQFKSSYDLHQITLHKCTGEIIEISSIQIQQNLGVIEKLDCYLFSIGNKTGVYFNGGNTYVPNTETVIGANTFIGTSPSWVEVGQLVSLEGLGGLSIESTGFNTIYGGFFVLNTQTPSNLNSKVQVRFNRHNYNLYETFINPSLISESCFLIFEKGFNDTELVEGNPWVSEKLKLSNDTQKLLKLEWSDSLNKGNIVFQSGISFLARIEGEFNPIWNNESETEEGDDKIYSIDQKSTMGFEVLIEPINQKQVTQLNIASSLEGFKVNNLSLVRTKAPEIKKLGKANLYSWKCEFGNGGNKLSIQANEIVLSPTTGVKGGGKTGKSSIPNLSGIGLYKDNEGNLISIDGKILKT